MLVVMDRGLFKGCSVSPSSIALSSQVENGLSNGKSRARWLVTDGPSLASQSRTLGTQETSCLWQPPVCQDLVRGTIPGGGGAAQLAAHGRELPPSQEAGNGGRKGFGRSGHRGAKHPVMLSATAPSTSGASLKKHCQISLTEMSFWEVTAGKWYNHI